jgi:hypothetical protein
MDGIDRIRGIERGSNVGGDKGQHLAGIGRGAAEIERALEATG